MERIQINLTNPDPAALSRAGNILRRGGVIIFPSDTCYGLGADARNPRAQEKIIRIKQRDVSKKFSIIVKDIEQIKQIAVVEQEQAKILETHLPGQYTFVLLSADLTLLKTNSLGVRIPDNPVTRGIAEAFGSPFISTSANLSGQEPIYSSDELDSQLLQLLDPQDQPDLVLDAGVLRRDPPSTVVDLTATPPAILRQGGAPFVWPIA